jgi:hypothetical protein
MTKKKQILVNADIYKTLLKTKFKMSGELGRNVSWNELLTAVVNRELEKPDSFDAVYNVLRIFNTRDKQVKPIQY